MATPTLSTGAQARDNCHMLPTISDDEVRQIQATHKPDRSEFDVKPLLDFIEDIMHHATPRIPGLDHVTQAQALTKQRGFSDKLELLADINRISCEISCKCSGASDAHTTTLALFNTLSRHSWDTKVVIALAAFAVNCGEFWLAVQSKLSNPLAEYLALLTQLPDIHKQRDDVYLKPKFEALSNLIKAKLDVTKLIVKFREFPSEYITPRQMMAATAYFPIAVYWTIRSIVVCAVLIMELTGRGHVCTTSTTKALASLPGKLKNIHNYLQEQWNYCNQIVVETMSIEAFQRLRDLFAMNHQDNMEILKALINDKDDQPPLVCGSTIVRIDVLKGRNVLLLISDLDISSHEEFTSLLKMYTEARENPTRPESQYEVLWLPVVDRTTLWNDGEQLKKFQEVQATMPWFSVYHHTIPNPGVIEYIKEVWHFNRKPLLVVMDPKGRVVHLDATYMIMIWGSSAFPFTSQQEEELWKTKTSPIQWLAGSLYESINNWVGEEKYICLYGGGDLDWIKNFTDAAKDFAKTADIPLEMIYVGKSKRRENVGEYINIIIQEKRSHILSDLTVIWSFWERLERLFLMQRDKFVENNPKLLEIMTVLLTFDGGDQGWAMISQGPDKMAKAKGDTILKCLREYEKWKDSVGKVDFMTALNENLRQHNTPHQCNHLYLSMLRKYEPDPTHVLDWTELENDENASFEEQPVRILDRRDKVLRGKTIPLVKVLWLHRGTKEATWELESEIRSKYPHLLED